MEVQIRSQEEYLKIINAWGTHCKTVFNPHLHQYTTPIINIRRNKGAQINYKWEMGLKEAMYQALLKEHYNIPNLREELYASPVIGMHDAGTPFGDISVLARGKLFITANGFKFVQQQYGYDNYQQGHSCQTYECQMSHSQPNSNLLALWTVRRIRHRDRYQGHIYEIEYAITPIIFNKGQDFSSNRGELNYEIPRHVFVIKTSSSGSNYQTDDVVKDKSQGYRHSLNGRLDRGNGKPSVPFGINSYVTYDERPSYLPPTTPNYVHVQSSVSQDNVIDTYKKLLESLSAKTTGVTRLPMSDTSVYPIPSPTLRQMTSAPHLSIDATTVKRMQRPKTTNTLKIHQVGSQATVSMQPSTSYMTVPMQQNARPIENPVNTQFFTPKTETSTKDVRLEKSSTSAREFVKKLTTPFHKIFYTKKPSNIDDKTKFTASKPRYNGEQTQLFRTHKPTQSMEPVKQKPVTTALPVFTNGQLAAPTQNFTSTLPYPIRQTTSHMQQAMERGITQQSARTTPVNILRPSPIPLIPTTEPSTFQTRKVQPTTLFEYFFETSPLPTISHTRQSQRPTYITGKPNNATMRLLVTNRMESKNTEPLRSTLPFLVTSGSNVDTTIQNSERQPIDDGRYVTYTTHQTEPSTLRLEPISGQFENTPFVTTQFTTGQVYNIVPTESTIYQQPTVPTQEHYSTIHESQGYTRNQPTTNRLEKNTIAAKERPSKPTTNHFNTYQTTNDDLHTVTLTQPAFYPVVTSYDQKSTLNEPTNIYIHIPTTPYFVATTGYPSTMAYQDTYPTQFTARPSIFMTTLQPTDFRLATLITMPSVESNQLITTTQPTYLISQSQPDSTLTENTLPNTAGTVITTSNVKTDHFIQTTQPTYVTLQQKPSPVSTNNFLADQEGTGQTSVNLQHPNDYSDDDIFGGPRKTSKITQKPTTRFTQSNLAETLFGKRPEVKYKSGNSKIRSLKSPKIIFSNFYRASTNPSVHPTSYFDAQQSNKINYPNTTQRQVDDFSPLTQQSYSTSISFHVNKKNESTNIIDMLTKLEFEPTIKAEIEEIKHPDGKFTIYKAKMPQEKPPAREKTEYKGKLDMVALQLINHAKSLDYIHSRNNTKPSLRPRKLRRGNSIHKSNRRQQRIDVH